MQLFKHLWTGARTLVFSNEELNDILKIVKSFEKLCLLLKGVSETTKNEGKDQKGEFLGMLLDKLRASLLGNILAGKGVVRGDDRVIRVSGGVIRAGEGHDF